MKKRHITPSATSLPVAPRTEADGRVRQYVITMTIRTVCVILVFAVQPLGWWTWIFALGAAFLPYIAVVFANTPAPEEAAGIESPERQISAPAPTVDTAPQVPTVIQVNETPRPSLPAPKSQESA